MTQIELEKVSWEYAWRQASYLPISVIKESRRENKTWSEVLRPYQDAFIAGTEYILNKINDETLDSKR